MMPRGARLLVAAQLSKAATIFVGITVLSRLLTPTEFGHVAVPVAIVGVGEILRDFGLSTAAITARQLHHRQRNLLFWANVLIGILLAGLAVVLSPLLAEVFDNGPLAQVLPVLSIVFVINGAGAQYRANLNRHMKFTALGATDAVAPLVGVAAAIGAAIAGAGYWALVTQQITTSLVALVLLVSAGRWVPGLPSRVGESRKLLSFGASVSWSQALGHLGNNVDTFALGLWSSPAALGGYNRAFQLAIQPLNLLKAPASSVAMPLLSRRQDDRVGLARGVSTGQLLIGYTVVPVAAFVAACSAPLVSVMLGGQWTGIWPLVSLLAAAGVLQQLASVANWVFLAGNHGKALRRYSLVALAVKAAAVFAAAPFGPTWVAAAYLVSMAVLMPVTLLWAVRVASLPRSSVTVQILRPLFSALFAGCLAAGTTALTSGWLEILQVLVSGTVFVAGYTALAVIPRFRADFVEVLGILLKRRR